MNRNPFRNFRVLRWIMATVLALNVFWMAPAKAANENEIRAVIETQLDAFARDDGPGAYAQAAPMVQMIFPTVDGFMAMVKRGYQPVYRNSSRSFGEVFTDPTGRPAMRVGLVGADGQRYEALYSMEQQKDGSWKIAGCAIALVPSQEV
jgi:hypothetical protein